MRAQHARAQLVAAAMMAGAIWLAAPRPAEANVFRGLGKLITGVLQVPVSTLAGTFSGPPGIGTAFGLLSGTLQGAGLIASGVLDIASSAVPIAKAAAPYVIPFLL